MWLGPSAGSGTCRAPATCSSSKAGAGCCPLPPARGQSWLAASSWWLAARVACRGLLEVDDDFGIAGQPLVGQPVGVVGFGHMTAAESSGRQEIPGAQPDAGFFQLLHQ